MKLIFAGDHAGFELKSKLIDYVRSLGHDSEDLGPLLPKAGDDYPDYVIPLAQKVAGKPSTEVRGIVVAGSGQGEIIAMNRVPGARAALFCPCNLELVKASRDHNDSNIFAIGARFCTPEEAKKGIQVWLETPFSNEERHVRRLNKIESLARS
ncbi:MAG TPA: ribose-5-phosphate isomerase [Candidatus Taylorbacteria bacterium]|nr:MAG: Ribose-5-phosphate isomerase B [Parcubacteria group bacterium GW2011_GWC2_48_17]HBV00901.1 ribose-5-phosphate isomerase [Candidatus Taylorbacteria bacterium]